MEQIVGILLRIIKVAQIIILLGSSIGFIYIGILFYFRKYNEVKKNLFFYFDWLNNTNF